MKEVLFGVVLVSTLAAAGGATADPVFKALDRNSDQRIEATELTADLVDPSDAWKRSRSKRWGEVAMDLSGHIDWSMLSYMIGNLNRPGPYGQKSTLLAKLDQDNDKSVDAEEAKGLLKASPDLRLRVSYGPGGDESIRIERRLGSREPITDYAHDARVDPVLEQTRFAAHCRPRLLLRGSRRRRRALILQCAHETVRRRKTPRRSQLIRS